MSDTLTGSIFDNPMWGMLGGAAQGFAQGAMPVPYKGGVPFGATLGFAAGDAMQGARSAYVNQIARQQAQQGQMQTQLMESQMPAALAQNKMMADMWSNPRLVQQMMGGMFGSGGNPSATSVAQPDTGSVLKNALSSLPDDNTRQMAINAAMRSGLPMEAWAPWISTVYNESQWNLNAPDGSKGEIGPGQVMPTTGQGMGFTPQQLRDPATNLLASAKYFGQQWKAGNGNPAMAFAGYNTGNPQASDPEYVSGGMNRLAQWGGIPDASGGGIITSQQAQAKADALYAQADRLAQQQNNVRMMQQRGFMVPMPAGDPAAIRQQAAMYQQTALAGSEQAAKTAQTITIDRRSGTVLLGTRILGKTSELHPVLGPDGYYHMVAVGGTGQFAENYTPAQIMAAPVVKPSELTEAEIEQAKEVGEKAGISPAVPQPGIAASPPQASPAQVAGAGGPPGPLSQPGPKNLAPGISAQPLPGGGSALIDVREPQRQRYEADQKELGDEAAELLQLQQSQSRVLEARNLAAQLPGTGSGGNLRADLANYAKTYLPPSLAQEWLQKQTGFPDAALPQEFAKLQYQAVLEQEKAGVGARGGARLTEMLAKANPGLDMQPDANRTIANLQAVAHQMDIDYLRQEIAWGNQHGQSYISGQAGYTKPLSAFDNDWLKQRNPQVYLGATLAMSGKPFSEWAKGLDGGEISRAISVVKSIDPTVLIPWRDGKSYAIASG